MPAVPSPPSGPRSKAVQSTALQNGSATRAQGVRIKTELSPLVCDRLFASEIGDRSVEPISDMNPAGGPLTVLECAAPRRSGSEDLGGSGADGCPQSPAPRPAHDPKRCRAPHSRMPWMKCICSRRDSRHSWFRLGTPWGLVLPIANPVVAHVYRGRRKCQVCARLA